MAISGDYSTPVQVNGFTCRNCTDVANAKKHIDPEHPRSGPYGITAQDDPTAKAKSAAVTFGGTLTAPAASSARPDEQPPSGSGSQLNITA